jgi:two-component system nitrate/nitrite sensor histidine kinase NarX/two-component system sensor histidine kinase UhpB
MKTRKPEPGAQKGLRRRAEQRLDAAPRRPAAGQAADARKQLHELHVHQIELEMQNLELQRIRIDIEEALARYTALYDFAPIGYFTLTSDSAVTRLNLTGATLLGQTRQALVGQRLADFVAMDSREQFAAFLARVFSARTAEMLEIAFARSDERTMFVHLEAIADEPADSCRLMVVDITARRQAEQRADELLRQNRALTARMFSVQESERRDLARELHDELGQWLTAIQAEAEAIQGSEGGSRDARVLANANAIRANAGEVHRLLRQMLRRLRPSLLDSLGLGESLQELTAQWQRRHPQIACTLRLSGELRGLSESLGITIYRIVQEALTNVVRHSRARQVSVCLGRADGDGTLPPELVLDVEDDGVGFDASQVPGGLGLLGMRERVIALHGEFSMRSSPQQGVRISVRLPLQPAP